ncbi:hypothetical protein GHT09_018629 [Marmota monax]|uniref:Uncharacterized protein n=1 Tax=Marmota monax TaxID=9995 RepID=A0A834Q1N7_MARMO|nr:hypothetical protein GHT09_018629 [Marmota monax]
MDYNSRHAVQARTTRPSMPGKGPIRGGRGSGAGLTEGAAATEEEEEEEDGGSSVRLLAPRLLRAHFPLSLLRILA